MEQAKLFRGLHYTERPLIVANAWDVGSAKQLEAMGFKAVATSSAALAETQGYNDGEEIPFDLLLQIAGRMKQSIVVPFSVDMERGFSQEIDGVLSNIEKLCRIGVAGINIEDSGAAGPNPLLEKSEFAAVIAAVRDFLQRKGLDIFINVRTDAFLRKVPNALNETMQRAQVYEAAGADGIFAPFIYKEEDIKALEYLQKENIDLIFLDIKMPDISGIEFYNSLSQRPLLIFTTAYAEHAVTSFEMDAVDYLLKPFSFSRS